MLHPSALDWTVELGAPAVAVVLLVWSLLRPRRRDDDKSS